jgi:phospholipid/cholesterol/gamma-HCH transport system substrate-binding protein
MSSLARLRGAVAAVSRRIPTNRPARLVAGLVALPVVGVALYLFLQPSQGYTVNARFASGQGLFPGTPVSLLGVKVGSVTAVSFQGSSVLVTMQIDPSQPVPAGADAQLVSPELLGEPDIDLSPGYTGGPVLASGATIPETRTEVPATTDQLLSELERVLGAVKPSSAHALVVSLAADLEGQGAKLNSLLANAASTVSLLADKGTDIGQLEGELASLTGTLSSHETELAQLVTAYDTVSAVLAGHQQQLGQAITQLADATSQLAGLLTPNLKPIEQDVAVVTTVGRTLDRNIGSLNEAIGASDRLFAAAHLAYDPVHNWLDLNDQLAPGMTAGVIEGLVRDRLAGVCRRLLAHHSAGLDEQALATLATCGNPGSGYFDPVLGLIQRVLDGLPAAGSSSPASALSALSSAVATIPGLTSAQRSAVTHDLASPPSSTTSAHHATTNKGESIDSVDQAIDGLLGPLPVLTGPSNGGSGSSTGPSGGTGTTGSGGLGGLLGAASASAPGWGTPGSWGSFLSLFLGSRA